MYSFHGPWTVTSPKPTRSRWDICSILYNEWAIKLQSHEEFREKRIEKRWDSFQQSVQTQQYLPGVHQDKSRKLNSQIAKMFNAGDMRK